MKSSSFLGGVRRLALGITLIALASGVLLYSDWDQRKAPARRLPRVAILQHASQALLDDAVDGMIDAMADAGYVDGKTISLKRFNAQNDLPTANAIAKEITSGTYDLVMTSSTLSLQAVANANKAGKVVHVFGAVADPSVAGVGVSKTDPMAHPRHLVGIGSFVPVEKSFDLAKKMSPGLKKVGVVWNTAEPNSAAFVKRAREVCPPMGIELLEANADSSSAVGEAASSLVARGIQALWVGGDVTVMVAIDAAVGAARKGRIPVFTITPPNAKRGALFDFGANFYEIGRLSGEVAVQVLKGADSAKIPIRNEIPERIMINKTALAGLKESWQFPEDVVAKANTVIDEKGTHEKPLRRRPIGKKWKIELVQLNNVVDVEECQHGVLEGLKESGLTVGQDYETNVQNAQGDMATVNALVDNAVAKRADMIVTFSTPTLQAAIQRARNTPIVFTYVASAVAAGAGKSDNDHLPNVTGVYMVAPFDTMLQTIRECLPKAHRIGTIFVPSEANSVFSKKVLEEAIQKAGMELVPVPANTPSEVPDAALAMAGAKIDAVCQIPGNLTAAAFSSILSATNKAKIPIFAFQQTQAIEGAPVVLARDYYEGGRDAGHMAARVMRGENTAAMPWINLQKMKKVVNIKAARQLGLHIPESVMQGAEVIGK